MNTLPMVCDYQGRDNEPCYGKVDGYFDGEYWHTFCEGHQAVPSGGAYVPKDPIRRIIFSEQNKRIRQLEDENAMLRYQAERAKAVYTLAEWASQPEEIEIPAERLATLEALYR